MRTARRLEQITHAVNEKGYLSVADLSALCQVSEMTIRRDLEQLAGLNRIQRVYGGAAYYPEHWPEERWPEDIRLMKEAALTVVRMAEFAWSTMEPSAGKFNFAWLERAVDLLAASGIASVLGTPTAAPPAWLVQESPDLLAVDENGRRVQFGNRCHYCVNSPELHAATRRLVKAMAKRFGPNPHVIGWQIDNEYNRVCYCDRCRSLFQNYYRPLAARNLNVDVISADEPLDGYKLVIAPSLLILKEKSVTQLKEFVRRGGYLVLTLRTGMKDEFNALLPVRQPGPLAELAGLDTAWRSRSSMISIMERQTRAPLPML